MIVYIPENLDLDLLVTKATKGNGGPKKDYLAYVVGVVSKGIYRENQYFDNREFNAPIWSELLKQFIGERYKKYIPYLIKSKVLFTNNQFFDGKARRYSFTEKYQTSFKPYTITDAKLIRKVELYYKKERDYAKRKLPFLYKWIKSGGLSIDAKRAESILSRKFEEKLERSKGKTGSIAFANIALNTWIRNIEKLSSKKYIDSFVIGRRGGGRLYTTLTNTSRDFRPFISYNRQRLCHVDIANSQPYFAALLLNPEFWEQSMLYSRQRTRIVEAANNQTKKVDDCLKHTKATYKFRINPTIKSNMVYQDHMDISTLLNSSENSVYQEFRDYKKYVSSGKFYQQIAEEYNNTFKPRKKATREDVKTWMFEVFFSKNPPFIVESIQRSQSKLFRKMFPVVSKIFAIIKKNKHNTLALLLQNLESQTLLHHICGLIAQKHPKIPLFTIHDSIVTTVGNEGFIKDIMEQELKLLTGLSPTLKTKIWDDSYNE